MTPARPKVPWSHWDRFLFIFLGIVLVVAVSLVFWFRALDRNPVVSVPTPTLPNPNAYNYYVAAGDAVVDSGKVSFAGITKMPPGQKPSGDFRTYSLAEKAALVAENAGAVRILHQGFRYPYMEPPARSFTTPFPQYAKERGLARFLALQAQVEGAKGDWNGAINTDLDSIQMGETMVRGGPLIGMLVGVACQAIGRRHAWDAVDHLNAIQAKSAGRRLESTRESHVPFADTLQQEEWSGQAGLLELMRQHEWPGNTMDTVVYDPNASVLTQYETADGVRQQASRLQVRLVGKRAIMSNYTQYMDQVIVNARQPYAAHPADPPIPGDPVSQKMLPGFSKVRIDETEANTQNALLLTLLALRAYKLEHGAYPASLSALAPGYLKAVPDDPFALSGPLRYRRQGNKYVLYSVGPDGKDDGGKPIFDTTKPAPTLPGAMDQRRYIQPDSQGDIVAGVNIS